MAQSATEKKSALHKQIQALQEQMAALDQEAVQEIKLKLADARKTVTNLELDLEQLTGKPTGLPKVKRERRAKITDEALQDQLLKVMANFGQDGLNAKQLAERLNQDPLRVRSFIKANSKLLNRKGAAAATKFFLP